MSEASIGTHEERVDVAWVVFNRVASPSFPNTICEVALSGQFATNQIPTDEILNLAKSLINNPGFDLVGGATHFFSPISMPKEGDPTDGYDIGGGLHTVPEIPRRVYFPSWTKTLNWVGNLPNVRQTHYMFFSPLDLEPGAQEYILSLGWNSISHTSSIPLHFDIGEVHYQGVTQTISKAVDSGWLYSLVYEWVNGNWQTFDIRTGTLVPGHTYWVYAFVNSAILTLPDPNSINSVDQRAIWDMENRGIQDGRFLSLIMGTFGKDLNWHPDWALRWMDFNFIGGRVVRMYHATYKANFSIRLTVFWDPDTNSWNGWTPAS
jgi:hypothetical protein